MSDHELQLKGVALRHAMLRIIYNAGAGHTGGGLSCLDILNVLYNRVLNVSPQTFTSPTRDRYVQSKCPPFWQQVIKGLVILIAMDKMGARMS